MGEDHNKYVVKVIKSLQHNIKEGNLCMYVTTFYHSTYYKITYIPHHEIL